MIGIKNETRVCGSARNVHRSSMYLKRYPVMKLHMLILITFSLLTYVFAVKKYRKSNSPKTICKEPLDLKLRLFDWYKQTFSSSSVETVDDDWIAAFPEPKICNELPDMGGHSSTMQRSLCPWHWKLNHDEHREPKILSEAHCLCRKSRGISGAYCMPIMRDIAVLRRILCNPITGLYEYTHDIQRITVGCHSVFPRTQPSSPLLEHYTSHLTREI